MSRRSSCATILRDSKPAEFTCRMQPCLLAASISHGLAGKYACGCLDAFATPSVVSARACFQKWWTAGVSIDAIFSDGFFRTGLVEWDHED